MVLRRNGEPDHPSIGPVEPIDPSVFEPRFTLWMHGSAGLRVFNPYSVAIDDAVSFITRLEGLDVRRKPSGDGSFDARDFDLVILYPLTWPEEVSGTLGGVDPRRPVPSAAMLLYRTRRATISTVQLVDSTGRPFAEPSDGALGWAGDYLTELGVKTMAPLTLVRTPTHSLAMSVTVRFEHIGGGSAAEASVRIAAVGLSSRMPPS